MSAGWWVGLWSVMSAHCLLKHWALKSSCVNVSGAVEVIKSGHLALVNRRMCQLTAKVLITEVRSQHAGRIFNPGPQVPGSFPCPPAAPGDHSLKSFDGMLSHNVSWAAFWHESYLPTAHAPESNDESWTQSKWFKRCKQYFRWHHHVCQYLITQPHASNLLDRNLTFKKPSKTLD